MIKNIIIIGAGGIGRACGLLLLEHFRDKIQLSIADISDKQIRNAITWINEGLEGPRDITSISLENQEIADWNPAGDLILDCTPGKYAPDFARVALRNHMHYANLTEHVPATREIYKIAEDANTGFALQTGLAPGYINILALRAIEEYKKQFPDFTVDRVLMRVGSLSTFASSPSFYAFVWSPLGVCTEYLNDCEVIEDYRKTIKPSLSDREKIVIHGTEYEADFTSGGAADLPTFLDGKMKELNYKTLRYPGHYDYIQTLKDSLGEDLTKNTLLQKMLETTPLHNQDKVLIYCVISGTDHEDRTFEQVHFKEIPPVNFGKLKLTAIQRTTAASLAQTAELLLTNRFKGILTQSKYPIEEYMNGRFIRDHYEHATNIRSNIQQNRGIE